MRARFFYGYGKEITFYDRIKNGENPVTDIQRDRIEEFLKRIGGRLGFYQIDGDDVTTLILLKEYEMNKEVDYEEWCPHCGGCTTHGTVTGSIQCMWCGEDLLPCSICRDFATSRCDFNAEPHSCRMYEGMNRVPAFCTEYDRHTEKMKMDDAEKVLLDTALLHLERVKNEFLKKGN